MPAYPAGGAFITIAPSFRGFQEKLSAYLKSTIRPVEVPVVARVDDEAARLELDHLAESRTTTLNVNADTSAATTKLFGLGALADKIGGRGIFGGVSGLGLLGGAGLSLAGPLGAPLLGGLGSILSAGAAGIGGAGILGIAVAGQLAAMKKAQQQIDADQKHLATLTKGTKDYRLALTKVNDEQKAFNKQFGLAAQGVDLFKGAWQKFLSATSSTTNSVIGQALRIAASFLPKLVPVVQAVGKEINAVLYRLLEFIDGPAGKNILAFFQYFGPKVIRQFSIIGINALKGLFGILEAFSNASLGLGRGLVSASKEFAAWGQGLRSSAFAGFLAYVKQNGPVLLSVLGNILKIIGQLVVALAPVGSQLLTGIAAAVKSLASLPTSSLLALTAALGGLAALLGGPVAAGAGLAVAVAALTTMFENAYRTSASFRAEVDRVVAQIQRVGAQIVQALAPLVPQIKGLLQPLIGVFTGLAGLIEQIWHEFGKNILDFTRGFLSGVIQVVKGMLQVLGGLFRLIADVLKGNWSGAWRDIEQIASGGANIVVGIVKSWFAAMKLELTIVVKVWTTIFSGLWEAIKKGARAGASAFIGEVKRLPSHLLSLVSAFFKAGVRLALAVAKGLASVPLHLIVSVTGGGVGTGIAAGLGHIGLFANGGLVGGAGFGDKMLSLLTPREFVNTRQTVDREGVAKFNLLNQGLATIVPLPAFALGGLAGGVPRGEVVLSGVGGQDVGPSQFNFNVTGPDLVDVMRTGQRLARHSSIGGVRMPALARAGGR